MTAIEKSQNRVRVCAVDELTPGNITRVDVQPPVAVYNIDGEFYATADWCSHDRSSLSDEGFIDGGQIECGWHFARFCIKSGQVTAPPASQPLATYTVEVLDGSLYVLIDN
ncbi:non-heme iron oxygenase ferredoxin subunit [Mycobacteroides sp. LB1]|uniref:non-heme iron oxygenase ferredoxin subunit n=1 Tax=Mycobacteroides sp. LB1 TaxID=2750814 RepID=UPI0015DF4844|nr:non-heme iron oxygenase ferredoxin subunit [Mycobacteroides sp. LB1]